MKKVIVFLIMVISMTASAADFDTAFTDTANYIYTTVQNPMVASIGGEWAVLGLARSEYDIPCTYYEDYYKNVEEYAKERNGVLHERKYTEYSRLIVSLTAIGKDPCNVAGYNLLKALGDYEKTIWQGINGPIWAIIALDCGGYEIPVNSDAKTQATRDMYINRILELQLDDGGWSLLGDKASTSDPDITAMALVALSKYRNMENVEIAVKKAISCLSALQNERGGYVSQGAENAESCAQVIVALNELGISVEDERFVKNGYTTLDNLMTFYVEGGGFLHTRSQTEPNMMATEQAFYALAAVKRRAENKSSLYTMVDNAAADEQEAVKIEKVRKKDSTYFNNSSNFCVRVLVGRQRTGASWMGYIR